MKARFFKTRKGGLVAAVLLAATPMIARAQMSMHSHLVNGITGPAFTLTAKAGYLSTGDGNDIYFWGYGNGSGSSVTPQYCGPTLIVNQGQTVTVTLNNALPVPTSIVFPGQSGVTASGGSAGLLTSEAAQNGGTVTYSFTASEPGTYIYNSGTQPDLQIEMGLTGALIVRPSGFVADPMTPVGAPNRRAYGHADSRFDQEFLFFLTEMDDAIHAEVEKQVLADPEAPITVDTTKFWPVYWFINGRTSPDTMAPASANYLPAQPYNSMPMMHPGQRLLMRVIGGGRDPHPFHHHGNHALIIAEDGRLLESAPSAGADLARAVFTIPSKPGGTTDAIFTWTGQGLGWDMYGHQESDMLQDYEDPADHGKPFPVILPATQDITFGQMYNGSPFMGAVGSLPPGEGGFNPNGAFGYMWHSHAEKEIINNDIFPGGMMTMLFVEAWPMTMP